MRTEGGDDQNDDGRSVMGGVTVTAGASPLALLPAFISCTNQVRSARVRSVTLNGAWEITETAGLLTALRNAFGDLFANGF